ncbi:MAG TPA: transporter [Polyangiaceae bacterium]|nr:transporter [Polyangiaceae bacterium]
MAWGQACCAGAAAVTPGRLLLHEPALIGVRVRAALGLGSYGSDGRFRGNPDGTRELDFEQDLFGTLRVLKRGQVGVLLPVLEASRATRSTGSEFGGGLGDVAVSARYDFVWAGENHVVPGIAAFAGASFPSGRAPEDAHLALASDATGVGAVRSSFGLALEQVFGPVLVQASALVAKRANRTVHGLDSARALEWNTTLAVGYSFPSDVGLAAALSYSWEGRSTLDGENIADSEQRLLEASAAISVPLGQFWRAQGALFLTPPISGVGQNRLTEAGASGTIIRSF